MFWTSDAQIGTCRSEPWLTDACENAIPDDQRVSGNPQVLALLTPTSVNFPRSGTWKFPVSMLLTTTQVVLAHKRGFGKNAAVKNYFRYDFLQFGVDLGSLRSRVTYIHGTEGSIVFYFQSPVEAQYLAEYAGNG